MTITKQEWILRAVLFLISAFIGAALFFAAYHGKIEGKVSFDTLASLAVAAGTIGLAYFTWELAKFTSDSIRKTNEVIAGEDRRHQQGLAPLVELYDPVNSGLQYKSGFKIQNIGKGLALNILVKIKATVTYISLDATEIFPSHPLYDSSLTSYTSNGGKLITVENEKSVVLERQFQMSALADKNEDYFFLRELHELTVETAHKDMSIAYEYATVAYTDMFGNRYSTVYLGTHLKHYRWEQPANLRAVLPDNTPGN